MDTRYLESFVTVVEQGSIAEAARRLNLTAAAIAHQIHTLEDEIGARLFARSGRTVQPTEAGASILTYAHDFLRRARDFKSIAASDTPAGELRLGAVQSAKSGLLPGILSGMTRTYPQIDIRIVGDTAAPLYGKVLDGELDAAICMKPTFPIPKTCDWRLLRKEPLVVLTSASAKVRDANTALASEPFIRLDRRGWAGRLVDSYLREAGIRPRERFEVDALETIAIMVRINQRIAAVCAGARSWAPPWPEGLSACAKLAAVPDQAHTRYIGLVWNRASLRVRLVQAFLEVAMATLASGMDSSSKRKGGRAVPKR